MTCQQVSLTLDSNKKCKFQEPIFFNFMKTISLSNNPEIYLLESPVTIDC